LVYSLGGPEEGSIFFDALINGIKGGDAAGVSFYSDSKGNSIKVQHDIVSLGDFLGYITGVIQGLNQSLGKDFSLPWQGSIEPTKVTSPGGFFFLSGKPVSVATVTPEPSIAPQQSAAFAFPATAAGNTGDFTQQIASGPVSSLPGLPGIKVFNSPEEYPVKGIDVSNYDGVIDWSGVKKSILPINANVTFAFIRATMGADRSDGQFAANWKGAQKVQLAHGAYHVYDFCQDVSAQLKHIFNVVPVDPGALPIAVDIEYYPDDPNATSWLKKQVTCYKNSGATEGRLRLKALLDGIAAHYSKHPIIFGDKDVFGDVLAGEFNNSAVWLHDYSKEGTGIQLPGKNPWTFWQFTDKGHVDGIKGFVDLSAFFSTKLDYQQFIKIGANISLTIARKLQ